MTRVKAKATIDAILKLRESATDEQALAAIALYPAWKPGVDYGLNVRLQYKDILYKVITAHTSQESWTPDVSPSLFTKVLIPDENTIPEWEQPDSTNPYNKGDKVTHNGKTWISDVDGNIWEPGVYGWSEFVS